jgi:hypothetical protein
VCSDTSEPCAGTSILAQAAKDRSFICKLLLHCYSQGSALTPKSSGEPDARETLTQVYEPLAQFPTGDIYMVVRPSTGAAAALTPLVRRVVARIDSDVRCAATGSRRLTEWTALRASGFRATIVGTFARWHSCWRWSASSPTPCSNGSAKLACAWHPAPLAPA